MLYIEVAQFTSYLRQFLMKSRVPGSSCLRHIETTCFGVSWLFEVLCCYCFAVAYVSSGFMQVITAILP